MTNDDMLRLEGVAEDRLLFDALNTFFQEEIAHGKPDMAKSNEQIGAEFRAREEAKRLVDTAFSKLSQFAKTKEITKPNPAR